MAILFIPARMGAKRLPGKPLLAKTGRPLILHVLARARAAKRISRAIVATDDERIFRAVTEGGGEAVMTRADHHCGTDRIAEAAERFPEEPLFVNLQGDEPEIEPSDIDLLVATLEAGGADMATLAAPLGSPEEFLDPAVVKVVLDPSGRALYFSRAPIPFDRDGSGAAPRLRHVGIYGFTAAALRRFAGLGPAPLELCERLEQLRALAAGMSIRVALVREAPPGIDTRESYEAFVRRESTRRMV